MIDNTKEDPWPDGWSPDKWWVKFDQDGFAIQVTNNPLAALNQGWLIGKAFVQSIPVDSRDLPKIGDFEMKVKPLDGVTPIWISTSDALPPEGKYVLARHNRETWHDSTDQENVNCVVVKMKKGISEKTRLEMNMGKIENPKYCGTKRSRVYCSEDEHGNNQVDYAWKAFGLDSFFGQEITHWMIIPPKENER